MKLYTVDELEQALKDRKCKKTDITTNTANWWRNSSGELFSVPNPDTLSGKYSDFIYYDLIDFATIDALTVTH